ncbi:mechanosensitive ion channel family protein [Candidatus Micrarchaeota archaeon]|nr:mechanosensitive ion channel family protein [Candidatus Micrarchaeota archaeon]
MDELTNQTVASTVDIVNATGLGALVGGNTYLMAIAVVAIFFLLAVIALILMKLAFNLVAKKTKTELDDKLLETTENPVFRFILLAGLFIALNIINLSAPISGFIGGVLLTLLYATFLFFSLDIVNVFVKYGLKEWSAKTKSTIDDEVIPLTHKTLNAVIWVIGIMMILSTWGIDIGPLLAGLGIAGLAISFAVQDSLANIFGGISLILDRTVRVGDKVELASGQLGVIDDIGLRSTKLRTYDNEIVIIPNSQLANEMLKNFVQPDHRMRVVVPFTVEYGSDPMKVVKVIGKAVSGMNGISKKPKPEILFIEMGDFSLNFKALFWVDDYSVAYGKKLEAVNIIHSALNKAKIGIPFPTQTVHLKK